MPDPDPIIIDDGGSTRIRRVAPANSVGAMDSLLDVDGLTNPNNTRGSEHTINDRYTTVMIVCQDRKGQTFQLNFNPFNSVQIASDLGQNFRAEKVAGNLRIVVFSATDPLMESKQHRRKRRYIVANSGPIQQVFIDNNPVPVYDTGTSGAGTLPAGAEKPILYTSVVIR